MKQALVASLMLLGSVSSLSAADYTWNKEPGETWQNWADPANWLVAGETATAAPGAEDIMILPQVASGSTWNWDLGGGALSVNQLFKYDLSAFNKYVDSYTFKNGELNVAEFRLPRKATMLISSGAVISTSQHAEFGANSVNNVSLESQMTYCDVRVSDGGQLSLSGEFFPRHVKFTIDPGGKLVYGAGARLNNCSQNKMFWYIYNNGTVVFEKGLSNFNNAWSCSYQLQQLDGELFLGGPFTIAHNFCFQIALTGGKVSATGDVSFKNHTDASKGGYTKFTDGADLDIEVADGKTLDLTPFTYDGAATIRKTGAGTLKLADVPTAISMQGGTVTFAANTQTKMTSLAIGEGQNFPVLAKNATIENLEALDGALSLAASGLTVKSCGFETFSGKVSVTKTAYDVGDVIISTPNAALRAAVKAAAEAAEMNVDEDGETLTVGEASYLFNSTTVTDLSDVMGWKSGVLPPEGVDVVISGEGVRAIDATTLLAKYKSVTVNKGAELHVACEETLPKMIVGSTAAVNIDGGANATLTELNPLLADELDVATTLPKLTVSADATLIVPDAMKFKNVALTINGTLAVDGASVYLGYAAAGETSYFELRADGGKILPKTDPETSAFKYYYVVPEVGGCVKVPSGVIHITNMPQESFAQGGETYVYMGAESATRQNDKNEKIELLLDNATLFTRNANNVWNYVLGHLGGGLTLHLKNGSAYRTWFANNAWGGQNGRCGGFNLYGNASIVMEEGTRFVLPVDMTSSLKLSPDTEREVLTVKNAYLHLHKTTGNNKGVIRMVGADNIVEATTPYWYSLDNGCDLFNGVKELNLDGSETKVTVVTWENGLTDQSSVTKETLAMGRLFNSGAAVTGEGSIVIGSTETDKGEWGHSWYRDLTALFGTSGNTCSGALSTGSDKTKIVFLNGSDWLGTVVSDGRISLGNPSLTTNSAAVTFGKVKLTAALPLRVWREEDGSNKSDALTLKDGFIVEEGDAGIVALVPQDGFALGAGEAVTLGTFPAGAFANVTVKLGNRTLKVSETPTEVEGVVTCTAKPASGFQIIIR